MRQAEPNRAEQSRAEQSALPKLRLIDNYMKLQLPSATVETSFRFAITRQQQQQHPNTNLAVSTFGFNCKRVKVVGVEHTTQLLTGVIKFISSRITFWI